jgi:hypothetical protein
VKSGRCPAMHCMTLQPITYRGRVVACATPERFFLSDELERRPVDDPERRFVTWMCLYAHEAFTGALPGEQYSDERARRFARAALIPEELLERGTLDYRHTGHALGVPAAELHEAHADAIAARP